MDAFEIAEGLSQVHESLLELARETRKQNTILERIALALEGRALEGMAGREKPAPMPGPVAAAPVPRPSEPAPQSGPSAAWAGGRRPAKTRPVREEVAAHG